MISVEEARTRILAALQPLSTIAVPLGAALGRYAVADVSSPIDLPLFDNSAMDGYAVRSEDLKSATAGAPVSLRCSTRIAAGQGSGEPISPGTCARVFTGSALPVGADGVVMQEDVTAEGGTILFPESVRPLENVRLRGEDLRKGAVVLRAGEKLNPARIGVLAATGYSSVKIHRPCKISLLATGNELVEPGAELEFGQIYESNRTMIAALLQQLKAEVQISPIVPDDLPETTAALRKAFQTGDIVISSGGVSVGEYDFVKDAFRELGGSVDLWQIAMRPGKPFTFGQIGGKFLFGLPGNPVSAFVTFVVLVRPAILKLHGATTNIDTTLPGELAEPISNRGDRRHFVRVRWDNGKIHVVGPQKSHMIASLADANGLVDVPPGIQLERGSIANVLVWDLPD
jgi:molybdopterin molybdotransferase